MTISSGESGESARLCAFFLGYVHLTAAHPRFLNRFTGAEMTVEEESDTCTVTKLSWPSMGNFGVRYVRNSAATSGSKSLADYDDYASEVRRGLLSATSAVANHPTYPIRFTLSSQTARGTDGTT